MTISTLPTVQAQVVTITFPEVHLAKRNAHQLRGYFGTLFKEHSPLLHNHFEDGRFRYRFPLVQYKVLRGVPTLVGFNEGGRLLTQLFLDMKSLVIGDQHIPLNAKNIVAKTETVGLSHQLHFYRFESLWMALNQENYQRFVTYDAERQLIQLQSIAVNNIRSVFKGLDLHIMREHEIRVALNVEPRKTLFKNQKMLAFSGQIVTNALLPDNVGIGKSVARGFGVVVKNQGSIL